MNRSHRYRPTAFGRSAILLIAIVISGTQLGCSVPNLESRPCAEARDTVKEFYSWYLGTDRETRSGQRDIYNRFVSPRLEPVINAETDPFFLSVSPPTTFKIGKCEPRDDNRIEMQVQLYWRDDKKTEQKEVYAEVVKTGDKWLIDKVEGR